MDKQRDRKLNNRHRGNQYEIKSEPIDESFQTGFNP